MMRKTIMLFALSFLLVLSLASAVRFDVAQARQEEWDRYQQYKADYIKVNDLEGYEKYLSERNLQREFGFYSPSHYAIPPAVLAAKYNPPLQGELYYTEIRGSTSSLHNPSAVKYYGEKVNGRYTGPVPSNLNGVYFDHPHANANGVYGSVTLNYGFSAHLDRYNGYPSNDRGIYSISHWGYYQEYENYEPQNARFYARIADQATDDYYVVGFY